MTGVLKNLIALVTVHVTGQQLVTVHEVFTSISAHKVKGGSATLPFKLSQLDVGGGQA